jgi:starch synthase
MTVNNVLSNPRILVVTPEITYLPKGMGDSLNGFSAKAGGLADVSAALINALFEQGADVHVALPDYRSIFGSNSAPLMLKELNTIRRKPPVERIHLAEDRAFFNLQSVYSSYKAENAKIALAFQREVINNIVPLVQPDLIHCNDWMTGLIPAMARTLGIPCLFTIHNIHTVKCPMSHIEGRGIDAASFWPHLFFEHTPSTCESARTSHPVDFLTSGISAAHFVNTVSPTFLDEILDGRHRFIKEHIRKELTNKVHAGCAVGILNAPDPSYDPHTDKALICQYGPRDHEKAKQKNKLILQEALGLTKDVGAPLFFWPSRLDAVQKGCGLMTRILSDVLSTFWSQNLQVVFVADGEFKDHFKEIVRVHNLADRVAVCDFEERLARLAYGAADFVLMPSLFEPCGLTQMIGAIYGALPVAHNTGGIHDTIRHLDIEKGQGNGFLFETHDAGGLFRAISQAMFFYNQPKDLKRQHIERIMIQSAESFKHAVTASQYVGLYEKMLKRPLINNETAGDIIGLKQTNNAPRKGDSDRQRSPKSFACRL